MHWKILVLVLLLSGSASGQPAGGAWPNSMKPSRTLDDTLQIDVVMDSMKLWLRSGEHTAVLSSMPMLRDLFLGLPEVRDTSAMLHRALQIAKMEGIAHFQAGAYPDALRAFILFQRIAERIGDPAHIGAAHNYQSYQYREMNDVPRCRAAADRAVRILRALPPDEDLANALTGLASAVGDQGHLDSANLYLREAVSIYAEKGNDMNRGSSLLNMTDNFLMLDQPDSAARCLETAIPLVEASGHTPFIMAAYVHLGRLRFAQHSYEKARSALLIADSLAHELEHDEAIGRVNDMLALVAAHNDSPMEAARLLRAGRDALIRDLDLAKTAEITEVRLKAEHANELAVADERLKEQRYQRNLAVLGGVVVIVAASLMLLLWLNSRRSAARLKRKNEQLAAAQLEVVALAKQREAELVRTQIARDIHDELGSGLTKIAMLGRDARHFASSGQEALTERLDRIVAHSREASAALSDIVWAVDPVHDKASEFVMHAERVATRLLDGSGVKTDLRFEHAGPDLDLNPGLKHHVLMVMKEAIHNAMRHARPQSISVGLSAVNGHFDLVVADDGTGFDSSRNNSHGNGLRNMRARAKACMAELTVRTDSGRGCIVRMSGPLA